MVRLAFFEPYYSTFYGAQESLLTLAASLDPKQYEAILVVPGNGVVAERFSQYGIRVVCLKASNRANAFGGIIRTYSLRDFLLLGLDMIKYNIRVWRWLRAEKVDIVCANNARAVAYVGLAAKLAKVPLIWYIRDDQRVDALHRLGSYVASAIITVSNEVQSVFTTSELNRLRGRIRTIYTGFVFPDYDVNSREWHNARRRLRFELEIPPEAQVVSMVASIVARKGHDIFVEAAAEIVKVNPRVVFVVAGDVPVGHEHQRFVQRLRNRIGELDLTSRFRWLGYREDVWAVYAGSDVVVLPSRGEGLPRVLIEALAAGCRVVASNTTGVREIITDGRYGSIVVGYDPSTYAAAILKELELGAREDDKLRLRRSASIRKRFDVSGYIREFEHSVMSLVRSKCDK